VNFDSPLTVAANQTTSLDVEFDLAHPAFFGGTCPASRRRTNIWAVNFNKGPVHHPSDQGHHSPVLRHAYGTVTGVSSDDSFVTITRDFPVEPPTSPETDIATSQSLAILRMPQTARFFMMWTPRRT